MPFGLVYLADVDPSIRQDMRYATSRNFLGRPARGYEAGICILTRQAAEALARVQARLKPDHSLMVLDCYRPVRAVADFMSWAAAFADQRAKAQHYPTVDKARLHDLGFISRDSRHSRGSAVDLTIVSSRAAAVDRSDGAPQPCANHPPSHQAQRDGGAELDFGTGYDCFHALSATAHPAVGAPARRNRDWLVAEMARAGFRNYAREWWHFELAAEPAAEPFDFPIRAQPPRLIGPPRLAVRPASRPRSPDL